MLDFIRQKYSSLTALCSIAMMPRISQNACCHIQISNDLEPVFCNPAIFEFESNTYAIARSVNYIKGRRRSSLRFLLGNHWQSKSYLFQIDEHRECRCIGQIDDSAFRKIHPGHFGVEDLRAVVVGKRVLCIGSLSFDDGQIHTKIAVAWLDIQTGTLQNPEIIESPLGRIREKNWMPMVIGGEVKLLYSVHPFVLLNLAFSNEKFTITIENEKNIQSSIKHLYFGGSNFTRYGEDYFGLVHRRLDIAGFVFYVHAMIRYNPLTGVECSKEFFFKTKGIEFATSLTCSNGCIIIGWGEQDRKAWASYFIPEQLFSKSIVWPNFAT